MSLADRFWSKVEKRAPSECWEWKASLGGTGYGQINLDGKPLKAHRVAWFLTHGSWPAALVCHHCDNPPCVNPEHLFLGTQKDNVADMLKKGRGVAPPIRRGEAAGPAKLTAAQVDEIRARLACGETTVALARAFGVSQSAVWWIKSGRNWAKTSAVRSRYRALGGQPL